MDQPSPWQQTSITFTDPHNAEQITLDHLAPALLHLDQAGLLTSWSFIRKRAWRIRYVSTDDSTSQVRTRLRDTVCHLRETGHVVRSAQTIYEPEIWAFGGEPGMDTAHALFHADSRNTLTHLANLDETPIHRRELSVLLCTALMEAAGLDWFERGDIWAKVTELRPAKQDIADQDHWATFQSDVNRLLHADTRHGGDLRSNQAAFASDWLTAFETAGRSLRILADNGLLKRGLRAVIAHHTIFHWNRMGLPYDVQANLAQAARCVVFD
ncbi:thiopeptide-type bacteriocin biosynthesis protein [Nonomuraea sp. NPDC059007]|uniref:thiopeptide-type bacteriocin biosynthesis protein n=1 Tax=Nonomuraea sp. NPDC059007 TaxID=3346692 RepID=UPI00368D4778